MSTAKSVLVTAANGNAGREVLAAIQRAELPVIAGVFDLDKARTIHGAKCEARRLDFLDRDTWGAALQGCDRVFLLRPPPISDIATTLAPFIDKAHALGVEQIVFLSVAGAGKNKLVPHHKVEQHLMQASQNYTILRPGFFAQNLQDAYLRDILEDDRIYIPAGRGRVAFVDLRDVAEVARMALQNPADHRRKAYHLTGPRAFDLHQAAKILSEQLGRAIRYEPASIPGYMLHLRRRGQPTAQILVQTILHAGLRLGQAEEIDPTLQELLTRPALDLEDYIRDHRALWER